MRAVRSLLFSSFFVLPAAAQVIVTNPGTPVVHTAMSVPAPLTCRATIGGFGQIATLPAGPMPIPGALAAMPASVDGVAACWWNQLANDYETKITFLQQLYGTVGTSTSAGPNEFVLAFASQSPRNVVLELKHFVNVTEGVPWPTVRIDLDNDGTVDLPSLDSIGSYHQMTIGPAPRQVRVILAASLEGAGSLWTTTTLRVLPAHPLGSTRLVQGCQTPPYLDLWLLPSFHDAGVDMFVGAAPLVAVIGLGAAPALLPSQPAGPCLLLPSPDIVTYVPPSVLQAPFSVLHLSLPAAVRPVEFYLQGVVVTAAGLVVTDGYRVIAP